MTSNRNISGASRDTGSDTDIRYFWWWLAATPWLLLTGSGVWSVWRWGWSLWHGMTIGLFVSALAILLRRPFATWARSCRLRGRVGCVMARAGIRNQNGELPKCVRCRMTDDGIHLSFASITGHTIAKFEEGRESIMRQLQVEVCDITAENHKINIFAREKSSI